MADLQTSSPNMGFVNSRKAIDGMGGISSNLGNASNYVSITAMRTRLAAANAGYYTAVRMDGLSVNDMIFALRNIDDATSIASYMTNSAA